MGDDNESLPVLRCQETLSNPLEQEQEEEVNDDNSAIDLDNYITATGDGEEDDDGDEDLLKMIFDRERRNGFKKIKSFVFDEWLKSARRKAISWILKSGAAFGFQLQTAYLSVTYFDHFLSRRSIHQEQSWVIELLSVACLSLAAKMMEPKPPLLSEYPVGEYKFGSKVTRRMELLVLSILDWRLNSVSPFDFLRYFIGKLCNASPPPRHVVARVVQLIFSLMEEINSMEHGPSVMAAAAILAVLDKRSTRQELECKMHPISSCGFLEIEEVFECYDLILKAELKGIKIPKFLNSPGFSSSQEKRLQDSSVSSAVRSKRRKLEFSE